MNQESAIAAATTAEVGITSSRIDHKMSSMSSLDLEDSQELVGSNPEERNWTGITISLGVILTVIGLVVLSVIILTPETRLTVVPNVTLSAIVTKPWTIADAQWVGSHLMFQDTDMNVVEISDASKKRIVIPKHVMKDNTIEDFRISPDRNFALLVFRKKPLYTYSLNASYYLYDIRKSIVMKRPLSGSHGNEFEYVDFGKVGNSLIYYHGGDLYYMRGVTAKAARITYDGVHGVYQNGFPDWVYEEEIFKGSVAIWWSPSGRYLAYASFDDRKVDNSSITEYREDGYPTPAHYKYPLAGGKIPMVKVHIYDVEAMSKVQTIRKDTKRMKVLHTVSWSGDEEIVITWSDRTFTARMTQRCSLTSCKSSSSKNRSDAEEAWRTDLDEPPIISNESRLEFYVLPYRHGKSGSFNHIAMLNYSEHPSQLLFLTSGHWEVTKLLKFDPDTSWLYYISNEGSPGSRHMYRINMRKEKQCVTCHFSWIGEISGEPWKKIEHRCDYFEASFGESTEWFYAKCLGPGFPFGGIAKLNDTAVPAAIRVMQPTDLTIQNMVLPNQSNHVIKTAAGHDIRIKALLPASVHAGERPVVLFKGDIGSQTVTEKFDVDLATYISKTVGAIAVFVDGAGSGKRGELLLRESLKKLGAPEIEDMETVVRYLSAVYLERVDPTRVGIVGTGGYGGYVAGLAMTNANFKCGVARSPVTDWKLFESFAAERILGAPSRQQIKYSDNSLLKNVVNMQKGAKLGLYQGLQDRKVNMQHSVLLKKAALLENVPMDAITFTYHPSTGDRGSRKSILLESKVLQSISTFLKGCLLKDSDEKWRQMKLFEAKYLTGT